MPQQLLSRATLGERRPQMVYLAAHRDWPLSVGTTSQVVPRTGIAVVQTDSWALTVWLIEAINAILDGKDFHTRRPPGKIQRSGRFEVIEGNLFVWGWPWSWSRSSIQVARHVPTALGEKLNLLCGATAARSAEYPG
ncbi:hypothetical protein [Gloeobacter violaceus]|uniref:Gll0044 protein n=1 Tax=Gloeobacter violaceus (strain ATCC 29082 / PCC 7421) TaxID=251221 RepID=Q7NPL1_GLOVI|nr:hypothetical protein [Gloeobacter violaceus]BAC87985.1 gll0044 [Gloeobacter violaceus PCC 7421]